jgi:predicted nucleic-acid-binding Zn-ribbon protein
MSCPKCGIGTMSGPQYRQDYGALDGISTGMKEYLAYTCSRCGYIEKRPTNDSLDAGSIKAHKLYDELKKIEEGSK